MRSVNFDTLESMLFAMPHASYVRVLLTIYASKDRKKKRKDVVLEEKFDNCSFKMKMVVKETLRFQF